MHNFAHIGHAPGGLVVLVVLFLVIVFASK